MEVVVTGLGAVSPLGNDVPALWQAMLAGRSGIAAIDQPWAAGSPRVSPARPT